MWWIALIITLPYFILLLRIYAGIHRIKPFTFTEPGSAFVSVVIACRNESENINRLLNDMALQEYPAARFEVIVVDDYSTDDTFKIATSFTGIRNLKVLKNAGQGKKAAIRTGVEEASGELLVTTDGDCRTGERWISSIAAFYNQSKPDMIICPVSIEKKPGFFGRFQELEFLSLQGITAGTAATGMSTMCNGASLAFTREAYLRHSGNLHPSIPSGDDIFLLHSLKKEKGSVIMWIESMDSLVTASPANTLLSFLEQRRRWISKGRAYSDRFTIILAIVTFVTIFIQAVSCVAGLIEPEFMLTFLLVLLIKSVPDFLILYNTTRRYGRKNLMKWFLPSQLVYPFYVLSVVLFSVARGKRSFY